MRQILRQVTGHRPRRRRLQDGREAIRRNREQTIAIRSASSKEARAQVLQVCEFELALAHLRVPEMA